MSARKKRDVRVVDAMSSRGKIQGRWVPTIRGVLPPEFFNVLEIPEYQRHPMKGLKHEQLFEALGPDGLGVPDDVTLCIPAPIADPAFHKVGDGELVIPTTRLVVLDGHQRVFASLARLAQKLSTDPLGFKAFLGTTSAEEIATFYQLNRLQTDVSSDVHLRNSGTNAAIEALKKLSVEMEGFPRIKWDQRDTDWTIKAHTLYSVAIMLHGYSREGSIEDLLAKLTKSVERVGTTLFTQNVRMFFEHLGGEFAESGENGLKSFIYRAEFMRGLALFLAHYTRFWSPKQPERLQVNTPDLRRLATTLKARIEQDLAKSSAVDAVFHTFMNRYKAGMLVQREIDA